MNKKIVKLISSVFILLFAAALSYAADYYTFTAEVTFSTVTPASITHSSITSVSSINGVLKTKASVDFGDNISATADLLYYLNGQTLNVSTVSKGPISHKTDFYISTPQVSETDTSISYQLKITLQNNSGTTSYLYWPSSSTYQTADIVSYSSGVVTASGGGTITFESGNQQYGNTKIVFSSGAFSTDQTITITELTLPSLSPSLSGSVSGASQMVALYSVTPLGLTLGSPARATFYYGTETTATKFELKRSDDQITWETVSGITTDLSSKTISADITKTGYYAIYTSSNLSDNDYRPAKRVVVQGRAVFKFNNLSEGDSVKIYNINGKRIKEIKSGDAEGFKWDGRKDNGSYAESGTYIYQIKVKEKGKLISGTIAFVK